jgi:hypothetical protein
MTQVTPAARDIIVGDQPIMLGKPGQSDLEHDLTAAHSATSGVGRALAIGAMA